MGAALFDSNIRNHRDGGALSPALLFACIRCARTAHFDRVTKKIMLLLAVSHIKK